jgi:hypothetical protein
VEPTTVTALINALLEQQSRLERIMLALERSARADDGAAGVVASVLPEIKTELSALKSEVALLRAMLPGIQLAAIESGKDTALVKHGVEDLRDEFREATNPFNKLPPKDEGPVVGGIRQFGALSDKHLRAAVVIVLGVVTACAVALTIYQLLKK